MWTETSTFVLLYFGVCSTVWSFSPEDNFGAEQGCSDPWTSAWTRNSADCSQVSFCVLGKVIQQLQCNDSRVWSNTGHACVEPLSQWDDCNQVPTTPIINDPRCVNPNGVNADPDNCAQFLACTNRSVVATMKCPENTLFSTRNYTCELGFQVADECSERTIPEDVVITTASPVVDAPCDGTANGDVEDATNCARFYKCNHGRVVARIKCPTGSAFSTIKSKCDWLAAVECGERQLL